MFKYEYECIKFETNKVKQTAYMQDIVKGLSSKKILKINMNTHHSDNELLLFLNRTNRNHHTKFEIVP